MILLIGLGNSNQLRLLMEIEEGKHDIMGLPLLLSFPQPPGEISYILSHAYLQRGQNLPVFSRLIDYPPGKLHEILGLRVNPRL